MTLPGLQVGCLTSLLRPLHRHRRSFWMQSWICTTKLRLEKTQLCWGSNTHSSRSRWPLCQRQPTEWDEMFPEWEESSELFSALMGRSNGFRLLCVWLQPGRQAGTPGSRAGPRWHGPRPRFSQGPGTRLSREGPGGPPSRCRGPPAPGPGDLGLQWSWRCGAAATLCCEFRRREMTQNTLILSYLCLLC